MTIPLWCLFAGVILPYIWAAASVPFRTKQFGSFDLQQPRLQAMALTEGGAGAWGAQLNQWEAIAVFSAATLAAYMTGVDPAGNWATASMVWVGARIVQGVFYILGVAPLRVLGFATSLAMSVWIFVMAMTA